MAKHEFGIMPSKPKHNIRYDKYEPEKYNCISIDDCYIELLLPEFENILCYLHTIDCPGRNIAYCGITLIPPESINKFIEIFKKHYIPQYNEILDLFKEAEKNNKFIIHFGI